MSNIPGVKYNEVGNLYGLRTWLEYGLKQSKNELGWAEVRVTNSAVIENMTFDFNHFQDIFPLYPR